MNKYQTITLIVGFILIITTWIYGVSQFQVYEDSGGFGRMFGGRRARIEQRIKQEVLIPTVVIEVLGTLVLVYLLRDIKNEK